MRVKEIACANWRNKDADSALVPLVESVLDGLAKDATMGTTKLLAAIMPEADNAETKCLISHLYNARQAGKLDGYWTQGKPNGGTFGKPSVLWHALKEKPAMTADQRKEWFRVNDPEGYAELYGAK